MTLIEKLLSVDKEKATEKETKKIKSKRLSKLVGEGAEITIKELSGKRYNSLQSMLYDKKGNRDMNATYDFNLMCCVYGVTEPCLTDHTLMEHFGAATPKDLAAILFGMESGNIAAEIIKLSGLGENAEDEVKNS
nr:MAG TPA: tail assembly chaperone protein [Caudoviricetes sp.]